MEGIKHSVDACAPGILTFRGASVRDRIVATLARHLANDLRPLLVMIITALTTAQDTTFQSITDSSAELSHKSVALLAIHQV